MVGSSTAAAITVNTPRPGFVFRSRVPPAVHTPALGTGLGTGLGSGLGVALLLSLTGCVNASVQEVRMASTGITSAEAVVILGRRQKVGYETEADFVACVGKELASPQIRVIPELDFKNSLFPWFEPHTAPMESKQLPRLLSQPVLAQRLKEDGVRYIVWVDGQSQNNATGSFTCSASLAGAGCFGFVTNDKDSSYEAQVWDLSNLETAGKITSQAKGTDYFPMVFVPIPIMAPVFGTACSGLANNLRSFITGTPETVASPIGAASSAPPAGAATPTSTPAPASTPTSGPISGPISR